MLLFKAVVAATALASFTTAHDSDGLPKIMGLDLLDKQADTLISNFQIGGLLGADVHGKSVLETRQDGRECGEGIGSCPQDKCCSTSGCTYVSDQRTH